MNQFHHGFSHAIPPFPFQGKKELRRYRRGGFLGEAALFGTKATRRIFSASVARGGGGCALLRALDVEPREPRGATGATVGGRKRLLSPRNGA
jgi:hypothetical protein